MKHQRGLTLTELAIAVFIASIVVLVVIGSISNNQSSTSFGFNGVAETRCVDGYKFIIGRDGGARQFMDESGRGVRCGSF